MAGKIADFLAEVNADPARREAFQTNPDAELDKADLTPEQRDILKSGDQDRIRSAVKQESGSDAMGVMFESVTDPIGPREQPE
jgi:Aromatic-ring-opening dioxygenase LigAB, LigA subunit